MTQSTNIKITMVDPTVRDQVEREARVAKEDQAMLVGNSIETNTVMVIVVLITDVRTVEEKVTQSWIATN